MSDKGIKKENSRLQAELSALREALTPSAETKAAYWGSDDHDITDWTGIKVVMGLIVARAKVEARPVCPCCNGSGKLESVTAPGKTGIVVCWYCDGDGVDALGLEL